MSDGEGDQGGANVREQDRFLPIANISRIMKKPLPGNAKIAKDAKETVQECVSEFISFITSEASDKCLREKRKTINGDDLLWAMTTLGFEEYVEPLKVYLAKFREAEAAAQKQPGQMDIPLRKDAPVPQMQMPMGQMPMGQMPPMGHMGMPGFPQGFPPNFYPAMMQMGMPPGYPQQAPPPGP